MSLEAWLVVDFVGKVFYGKSPSSLYAIPEIGGNGWIMLLMLLLKTLKFKRV